MVRLTVWEAGHAVARVMFISDVGVAQTADDTVIVSLKGTPIAEIWARNANVLVELDGTGNRPNIGFANSEQPTIGWAVKLN